MKAKLKNLREKLTPGRSNRVSILYSSFMLVAIFQLGNDKPRFTIETGRDALGLKVLVPGYDPVIEYVSFFMFPQ
jgi:hypothetical protein